MNDLNKKLLELDKKARKELRKAYEEIDGTCEYNSIKVLEAFKDNKVSEIHFNSTTGYGYNDLGREVIEKVYAEVLGAEDALVRNQFISGSHALTVTLFALLRPNDILLSITGKPYDTLDEVIGIKENKSSLKSFNIDFMQIDLINNDFNYDEIKRVLKSKKIKVIEIQRSKGYSSRKSISIDSLEKVISFIRAIDKEVIIMVDNCYCELVSIKEPTEVGADIMVGSLIKNLGAGIAPNGAYIAGNKDLIELCAERLTLPGEGKEVGPTLGINKQILQGLFLAPKVVSEALKTALYASYMLEKLGHKVEPNYKEKRADIVQSIIFNDRNKLIKFCQGIQASSPIDAHVMPVPSPMPGYDDEVIMAAGSFIQGSSIETSCDGPLREPFIAYLQGSLTLEYGRLAVLKGILNIEASDK